MAAGRDQVDGARLRAALRHVPSPVAVVTAAGPGEVRGMTIGSFTSVSLDPPLVSFNVSEAAQMYPVITAAPRFVIHVLTHEQAYLAGHFAIPDQPGRVQFREVPHRLEAGIPILDGVLAVLHCRRYAVHRAGDHALLIGEVERIDQHGGEPLLYYGRSYRRVGEVVTPAATVNRGSSGRPAAPGPKSAKS